MKTQVIKIIVYKKASTKIWFWWYYCLCFFVMNQESEKEASTYREAMEYKDSNNWYEVIKGEIMSLHKNNVLDLFCKLHNNKLIQCK